MEQKRQLGSWNYDQPILGVDRYSEYAQKAIYLKFAYPMHHYFVIFAK